jgi:Glycosyl transferases group 1
MPSSTKHNSESSSLFISWAPFCSRSDSIAKWVNGVSHMVYAGHWGSHPLTIFLKYLEQSCRTLAILFKARPRTVFVMTPPVIACFPVWIYCKLTNAQYVIDAHSGAFLDSRWKPLLFVHKFFSRHAAVTIVTGEYLYQFVQTWNATAMIVGDVPVCFAEPKPMQLDGKCNMTLVNTFTHDEPLELFVEAARKTPDIQFYVTGDARNADAKILRTKPDNLHFTGFLPNANYVGLLMASDAVICLTTLPHTMQRGAYEAVYLGKPVVTSNTELLRKAFNRGAVHVDNNIEDIVAGLCEMRKNLSSYQSEVQSLRREKLATWNTVVADLSSLIKV